MPDKIKIVADENISLLHELFGSHAELLALPGREIKAADVRDADVLLVRSVTTVNKDLLANSRVKFVGSCTIGSDHLDTQWLEEQGIHWACAPGCNADAVVDYVLASLLALHTDPKQLVASGFTVGIVGCGNVGSRLQKRLQKLGVPTLCCDPFLKSTKQKKYLPLEEVMAQSDMLCLHTPLTSSGKHPTFHLINDKNLGLLKANAVLLNAGRGAVVDNKALLAHINKHPQFRAVLDVWENEPQLSKALLDKTVIGTPHIAGYSVEGKQKGTEMIYQAFCQFFNKPCEVTLEQEEPIVLDARQFSSLRELVLAAYNPLKDSEELKNAAQAFDKLRKLYIYRREFSAFQIRKARNAEDKKQLRALGFGKA